MKLPALLCVALVATTLTTTEAHAADPAPTNVQISWKDDTFQAIHVTWDEDTDPPNVVRVRWGTTKVWDSLVPAGSANEIDIPKSDLGTGVGLYTVAVAAGTAAGDTSPMVESPRFDHEPPNGVPETVAVSQAATGVTVQWKFEPRADSTPNDPLDRPDALRFLPQYEVGGQVKPLGAPISTTVLSFSNPAPTYNFSVRARNEWSADPAGAQVSVRSAKLTAQIPSRGLYGRESLIQGNYGHPVERHVILHARNSATSPWYVVGTTVGNSSGGYAFRVTNRGTRQYRVVTANFASTGTVWYGATSGPATLTTVHRVTSVGFYTPVLKRGQTATADLNVDPRFNGRVDLQRWNGKTWVHVKDVLINSGFARGTFVSTIPGRVAYRYYVPNITYNGLFVAATYSPNFVLTTS